MKFKFSKLIALTLCLSIIFSCALPSIGAAGINTQHVSFLDFEDKAYTKSLLETKQFGELGGMFKSDFELIEIEGNTVFKPAVADNNDSPALTTFKDEFLPEENIQSVTFNAKVENGANRDNFLAIYSLYDEDNQSGAGISFTIWDGKIYFRKVIKGEAITTNMSGGNLGKGGCFSWDETLTITLNYDYSDYVNGNIYVDYMFVSDALDENGLAKKDSFLDVKYTVDDATLPFEVLDSLKFGIGSSRIENTVFFDNLSITYGESVVQKANAWYKKYLSILSKTPSEFDENTDLDAWNNALADYEASDEIVQELLYSKNAVQKLYEVRGITETAQTIAFEAQHSVALQLTRDNATKENKEVVDSAIVAYQGLDTLSKLLLKAKYNVLLDVQAYMKGYIPPKANDYDKTPIFVNFEGGFNPFVNSLPIKENEIYEFRKDPLNSENTTFYAENFYSAAYLMDDKYWPYKCMPNVVSFKLFMADYNPFARFSVMLSYFDEENYSCVQFENQVAHYKKVVNGVSSQDLLWNLIWEERSLDWSDWVTVNIYYSEGGTAKIVALDKNDESATGTAAFVPGGKFGFSFFGGYNIHGKNAYIDDVNITFVDADFDLNTDLSDIGIRVYYTGNNYVGPDETLFISGERLGKTVDKAYIMKLNDVSGGELSYIAQESAFTDGMDYYDSTYAKSPSSKWDESKAQEMRILQRSDLSLNTVIPKDIGDGVYIIKLTSLISGVEDKYVYVNAPVVNFVNGDEGKTVTAGGAIRIVGHNLNTKYVNGENTAATVKLKNLSTGEIYTIAGSNIKGFGDNSALEAVVPNNILGGEYAVYVHSGIGDETAYSIPGYIKVGENPRDSWGLEKIFNVRDTQFAGGAKGDGNTNDTPAFMEAFAAAYEAGGGTVYVPAGSYRVLSTLPIPQNVHLKGEDNGNTMIFWTARRWDFNKLPDAHIRILGNCEISDIYFYGTRINSFIDAENATDGNIYIHDIRTNFVWYAGAPTNAGSTETTGKLTNMEIAQKLFAEMSGEKTVFLDFSHKELENIQISDVWLYNPRRTSREIVLEASHSIVHNVDDLNNWIHFGGEALIVEDCEISGCVGPSATGLYYARNNNLGTGGNNKELMTTDGGPFALGKQIQFIGNNQELMEKAGLSGTDTVTYRFIGLSPSDNSYVGRTINITSGQGLGQSRQIVWQKGQYFKVEKPFAVTPNRNGTVSVTHARISMQFINSFWKSGDAVGTYGTMIDGLFDGNTFADFGTQVFDNQSGSLWYLTNENNKYTDPVYVHGDGAGITLHEDDIYSLATRLGGTTNFGNIGWAYRSNDIEGYWFLLTFCTQDSALEGYLVEDNNLHDLNVKHSAFELELEARTFNNMLLRNNLFDVENVYNARALSIMNTEVNKYGSFKLMTDYFLSEDEEDHMGDVNLDGKVSIKDSTLVRLYFIGLTELSNEQITNGDVNDDGVVDLKDASQIRRYILTGEKFISSKDDSWIDADY
ncbi:MAG: hypothetical protein J6J39_01230 [Clostridia bacterium]|nr:hypothetical protein [Clostridia bacterium]